MKQNKLLYHLQNFLTKEGGGAQEKTGWGTAVHFLR